MNKLLKINQSSHWAKLPMWKKRLNGFACYSLAAMLSLWHPIAVDMETYKTLKEQFED